MKAIQYTSISGTLAAVLGLSIILTPISISLAQEHASRVSIAGNGYTIVRGAEVTAVGARYITVKTSWDGAGMVWTVDTGGATKFFDGEAKRIDISKITIGDTIDFSGAMDSTAGKPTIHASLVKNVSSGGELAVIDEEAASEPVAVGAGEQSTGFLAQLLEWLRGPRGLLSLR